MCNFTKSDVISDVGRTRHTACQTVAQDAECSGKHDETIGELRDTRLPMIRRLKLYLSHTEKRSDQDYYDETYHDMDMTEF